jgi:hypothetical protein
MKKIGLTLLAASLLLAACQKEEVPKEKTKTEQTKTNTNVQEKKETIQPSKLDSPLSLDEAVIFLFSVPEYTDAKESSFSAEEGKDEYSIMFTTDTIRKTFIVSKDGSKFYSVETSGKETTLDNTNAIEIVKGLRSLKNYYQNKPELTVEFDHYENAVATYHVYEQVDVGEPTEHNATYDWVNYDLVQKLFTSEIEVEDYSTLK